MNSDKDPIVNSNIIHSTEQTEPELVEPIPVGTPLTNIKLPNEWVLYLYDKQLFKKLASKPNFQAKPYTEVCILKTVNDLVYILQLMKVKAESKVNIGVGSGHKINLDMNDYIIMRKGIAPIWEDPKNSNGGTFTVKMSHHIGYDVWSTFIMYMLGETLTPDMTHINGITVSYISDSNNFHNPTANSNNNYTYIKVWDGKQGRSRDEFINILPFDIVSQIKNSSIMYTQNNTKDDFGKKTIIDKLAQQQKHAYHNSRNRKTGGGFRDVPVESDGRSDRFGESRNGFSGSGANSRKPNRYPDTRGLRT